MYVIMLGGPGTGKGTIGEEIASRIGVPHIATGDIFRAEIKENLSFGKKIKKYMDRGLLVPDKIVLEIVKKRLLKADANNGAVLDGFPRTKAQAVSLGKFLKKNKKKVSSAILLDVADEDIVKRLVNRVVCSNKSCGQSYNTMFKPPKCEGICDKCGSKLIVRADDNEETVKQRLKVYHKESKKLLRYYKKIKVLHTIKPDIYSKTTFEDTVNEAIKFLKK